MEIKFETVKKLLLQEYASHYNSACQVMRKAYVPDAQMEMVCNGYQMGVNAIESSSNWDELDSAISTCGYRMSLQDWLDSY